MEDEQQRLYPSRQNPNPRNLGLGFLSDRPSSSGKPPISSDPPQKPPPPILDRFRSLLRDRDEQMRDSDDRPPPPPTMEEIVALYEDVLSELIFNSKPIITELTIIAGEHKDHGEGIADAICARILEVPIDQKLPSLYLLDSIVKNIGRDYVRYFAARLPEVFCEAYKQVHPNLYPSMRHLFGTWSAVFPSSVLHKIEAELRFSPPANRQSSSLTTVRPNESPSPRPHGIHVNPKYLEARRQFEHSTVLHETDPHTTRQMSDFGGERIERNTSASPKGWSGASSKFHVGRGVSSNLRAYGRNSTTGYGEYDDAAAAADVLPPEIEAERVLASSNGKFFRPPSPKVKTARSLSPPGDGFIKAATSERDIGRVSPSRSGFGFSINQVSVEDGKRNDWLERHWSDNGARKMKTSGVSNLSNGHDQQRPRALIDAYGNYRGKSVLHDNRLPKFEKPDVNGINSNTGTRNWQNIEEEEYDWEDMSPALVDRNRGNDFVPSDSSFGSINIKAGIKRPNAAIMDPSFTRNDWRSHTHLSQSGHGSIGIKSLSGTGTQNGSIQYPSSHYTQEPWNLPHHFLQSSTPSFPNPKGSSIHTPFAASGIATSEAEVPFPRFSSVQTRLGVSTTDSSILEMLPHMTPSVTLEKNPTQRPHSPSIAPIIRPPVHSSHPLPLLSSLQQHNQIKSHFDLMDANKPAVNLGQNNSFLSRQQLDVVDGNTLNSSKLLPFTHSQAGLIPLNRPSQEHSVRMQASSLQSREPHEGFVPPTSSQPSTHLSAQPPNYGHLQGQGALTGAILPNALPGTSSSSMVHCIPGTSFQVRGVALPPLPPGPPPSSSQMGPAPQNTSNLPPNPPPGTALSGLISSLVAQGLISLTTPSTVQDSVGVEFNAELLKVRHESAINALYVDLPRQCTTCGLRFKFQEEHRNHMDWHVTKNRLSKNRKQNPSRKWFVSAKEWLSGAEALGTDAVPGFLPAETVIEKREDEEMAVPADENQSVCALCGEPFDDFYSDETEEWMYKGAVYLNAPDGSIEGMERSQLGPIVHAKCRSESTVVTSDAFGQG
ncbi:polyadenylation and cleavage factor 4 [Cinnamomum micranthum f. kanehirae]|uniref:Polyadenylation and cleavage factor 4 n=1 Tax=Cinnamomum micranthum f. kanehirae TaxID=337451 RepID=A0A443P2R5_9MAGN|nr:polyadenylation and cleavage factor 4 [Cinnamomum micranthum f. kanehirae]